MTPWLIAAALFVGLLLILAGRGTRQRRGLINARTLDLDRRMMNSRNYGLAGRPDRIVEGNIPEEWKSARRAFDSHKAQMGVYILLIEEETGVRPPHGFVVTGDGPRHLIENTDELRAWVLSKADQIKAARRQVAEVFQVNPPPAKCRSCGQRENCGQSRG